MTPSRTPGQPGRPCIFISYSHKDLDPYARKLVQHLTITLRGSPELGMQDEDVFLERNHVLAGDEWSDLIEQKLREASYLVFLMSADSLDSNYCLKKEVATAAANGVAIIPVWLKPVEWKEHPVPGDPERRTLEKFDAVPRWPKGKSKTRPLEQWTSPDAFYEAAARQIVKRMQRDLASKTPPGSSPLARQGQRLPRRTAYSCNQDLIKNRLRSGLEEWGKMGTAESGRWVPPSKALIAWVEGESADEATHFCDHLCENVLHGFLTPRPMNVATAEAGPHPSPWTKPAAKLPDPWIPYLSGCLTGVPTRLNNEAEIGEHLAREGRFRWIKEYVACDSDDAPMLGRVRALLDLMERVPQGLGYLGLFLVHDALPGKRPVPFARVVKASERRNSMVIDLGRVSEIQRLDVAIWWGAHVRRHLPGRDVALHETPFWDAFSKPCAFRNFAEILSRDDDGILDPI